MGAVIVSSAIANKPFNGGNAWAVLNWVLGLKKLGFEVYFVEQLSAKACADGSGNQVPFEESANLAYFKQVTEQFGLEGSSSLLYEGGLQSYGLAPGELLDVAGECALLVNISGHLTLEPLKSRVQRKAYIDFDPGYTQFWHAQGYLQDSLAGHDYYFTLAENIGRPGCELPTAGIDWRPVRQPIVLDYCTPVEGERDLFTTVASWRGAYGPVYAGERKFGLKAHEFRKFMELPRHVPQRLEVALDIHPAEQQDIAALESNGWILADPRAVAAGPDDFQRYIERSGGEFSVAQGIYVETNSGWFSDRTVRYLALGKPALVQDTGFSANYPVGEGLVPFTTMQEAIEGAASINERYCAHSAAARAIAEECFDSDKVLGRFIEEIGIAP